jgi:hypothetical protein
MRRLPLLLVLMSILGGCQSSARRSDAIEDGLTLEHAVVLTGGSDVVNVSAEYAWIRRYEPSAKVARQALIVKDKRAFDELDLVLPDGTTKSYYFDIIKGFGKMF